MRDLISNFARNHPELYGLLIIAMFGLIGLAVEKFYAPEASS